MTWVDIVIIVLVGLAVASGFSAGFLRQAISIFGYLGGIVLAGRYYLDFAHSDILRTIPSEDLAKIVAFGAIFVAVNIVVHILGGFIQNAVNLLFLGCVDRVLGGALGALEAGLFMGLVIIVIIKFSIFELHGILRGSALTPYLLDLTFWVLLLLPPEFETVRRILI